jgi:hypothetical protein
MSNRKPLARIAVTMVGPGRSRPVTLTVPSLAAAAQAVRGFASRRGVSPLAIEWSARLVVGG